jgi:hypothetical protein
MLSNEQLAIVNAAVGNFPTGNFSVPQLGLPFYRGLNNPAARGVGKSFYDSVMRRQLDTPDFIVRPVPDTKSPKIYEKIPRPIPPHFAAQNCDAEGDLVVSMRFLTGLFTRIDELKAAADVLRTQIGGNLEAVV